MMKEVFPRRIVGAFPGDQYLVILEDQDHRHLKLLCNKPYDKMIYSCGKLCARGGWLVSSPYSGMFKRCMIVDREGIMSFVQIGDRSVNDYGSGLAMHGALQHGTSLFVDESIIAAQNGVKERLERLEEEVGVLFPLPKLESTSQLRAACEFLGI